MTYLPGRPQPGEYDAEHYGNYVSLAGEEDIVSALAAQLEQTLTALRRVPAEREGYRYAPEKWTIRQVIGHVADAERVFAYRALTFARGDGNALPGFDENAWMEHCSFGARRLGDLLEELADLRRANVLMLRHLPQDAWMRRGTASGMAITVRALAHVMLGHERHHLKVLKERYGV